LEAIFNFHSPDGDIVDAHNFS